MAWFNLGKKKKAPEAAAEFPFADAPNTATIACSHVIEANAPILYVSHDEDDGMWQFLCSKAHEIDEARLVSLKYVYESDHSVGVLASMPCGCIAVRTSRDAKWVIKKH